MASLGRRKASRLHALHIFATPRAKAGQRDSPTIFARPGPFIVAGQKPSRQRVFASTAPRKIRSHVCGGRCVRSETGGSTSTQDAQMILLRCTIWVFFFALREDERMRGRDLRRPPNVTQSTLTCAAQQRP